VEATGGVDDDDVPAALGRRLDRVVGDGRRIAAALAPDEVGLRPLGPDLELLLGRCAEGVRRAEDDGAAVLAQALGELADRGRLPSAVDADDEDDAGRAVEVEPAGLAEQLGRFVDQSLA
jgi:hypothetical protein